MKNIFFYLMMTLFLITPWVTILGIPVEGTATAGVYDLKVSAPQEAVTEPPAKAMPAASQIQGSIPENSKPKNFVYSAIRRIGFVKDEPVEISGRVTLLQADKEVIETLIAMEGERLYVQPADGAILKAGEVYVVCHPPKPVQNPATHKLAGVQYYKTGMVRIVESLEDHAVAKIEKAFHTITVDDILLPYEPESPNILMISGKQDVEGNIFKAEDDIDFVADNVIAFIDKGFEDGIQTGQVYAIYDEYPVKPVPDKVDFGTILVLHTETTTATVLITRSDRTFHPPCKFRYMSLVSSRNQ